MRLRQIHIEHFRGIERLEWRPAGPVACLIGSGNATKTTVLDAIELALLPRWFAGLSDDDFTNGDTAVPIVIEVTVGDLPKLLIRDDHLGHYLRGWSETTGLEDEPRDGLAPVVTVRFTADSSLEPSWSVVNDRIPDGIAIPVRDREKLGVARLGDNVDRQLTWMRGSALPRLAGAADAAEPLASAIRAARGLLQQTSLPREFTDAAESAYNAATAFGAAPSKAYEPRLGSSTTITVGALELFEGAVPARMAGLGSRRLAALAIQLEAVRDGAILLIDEIEAGLEPHRIGNVLRRLKDPETAAGHTFLTTHSPVVLRELAASDLYVVRKTPSVVTIEQVATELQDVVRSVPGALLAGRIALCEGKTEHGVASHFVEKWERERKTPLAHHGSAVVTGTGSGGSAAPLHAQKLRSLGYDVALFADSDVITTPSDDDLRKAGVTVIRWADASNTEKRAARDLPLSGVQEMIDFGVTVKDEASVKAALSQRLNRTLTTLSLVDWIAGGVAEDAIRDAVADAAAAAKGRIGWFKQIERGRALGAIIERYWDELASKDLREKLEQLEVWLYA